MHVQPASGMGATPFQVTQTCHLATTDCTTCTSWTPRKVPIGMVELEHAAHAAGRRDRLWLQCQYKLALPHRLLTGMVPMPVSSLSSS